MKTQAQVEMQYRTRIIKEASDRRALERFDAKILDLRISVNFYGLDEEYAANDLELFARKLLAE